MSKNDLKDFLESVQRQLDEHLARDTSGPVEVSPADLARLLSLSRITYEDSKAKYPWVK